jgi:tetratricopeptide (TPR) repeat protein
MGRSCLILLWFLLLSPSAMAAPSASTAVFHPRSADALNQTAMLVYQDKAREAAQVRLASAELNARDRIIAARDQRIAAMEAEQARDEARSARERAARQTEIDRLTAENSAAKLAFAAELAARDRDYARERSILLSTADRLLQTPEGSRVLQLFNSGGKDNWQEAKVVLAQMQKLRTATDRRDGAVLYLQKRARGEETTDACITEYEAVVAADPREYWDWIELANLYRMAGRSSDAHRASQQSLANAPDDQARSIALTEIGEALLLSGDYPGALAAHQQALSFARHLAEAEPDSADAKRNLAISINKVGHVLMMSGNLPEAEATFAQGLAIARSLADPGSFESQRDLATVLIRLGDVRQLESDYDGALAAFEEALAISRRVAGTDSALTDALRDVSIALGRVSILRPLAGDLPGGMAAGEEGLAIAHRLAERDPGSAQARRDVSVSLSRLGDVRWQAGDRTGAQQAYGEALKINRELAARDPGSAEAMRDVAVTLVQLALFDASGIGWQDVVDVLTAMDRRGWLSQSDAQLLAEARALAAETAAK